MILENKYNCKKYLIININLLFIIIKIDKNIIFKYNQVF